MSVKLLPISRERLPLMRAWRNDPQVYQWCRQFEPVSETDHERWFQSIQQNPTLKMYTIHHDIKFVGVCGLTSIDWINRCAEFSLYIGPEHQGKGLGKLALHALVRHGFEVLNLNCIWGEVFDGNPALESFKAVGFKPEGVRRQFYYRDGKYIDAHIISLLKDEYVRGDSASVAGVDIHECRKSFVDSKDKPAQSRGS